MALFQRLILKAQNKLISFGLNLCGHSKIGLVAVFNGSFLNLVSKNTLSEFISKNSKTDNFDIYMPERKYYSVVKFTEFDDASTFVKITRNDAQKIISKISMFFI